MADVNIQHEEEGAINLDNTEGSGDGSVPLDGTYTPGESAEDPSQTPGDKSPEGTAETPEEGTGETPEGEEDGTGGAKESGTDELTDSQKDPETGEKLEDPTKFWFEKFQNSSRGVQDLLTKNATLQSDSATKETRISELETEVKQLREVAEGKNPEGLNMVELEGSNKKLSTEVATLKESIELNNFVGENPVAKDYRDSLKNFMRAFPDKSLDDIWKENFASVVTAKAETKQKKTIAKKDGATDPGQGTSTAEPSGDTIAGVPVEKFNKLPVSERRKLLQKQGQSV